MESNAPPPEGSGYPLLVYGSLQAMEGQGNPSCFARLLDIRFFIVAARRMVAECDATVTVVLIIIFAIIGLCLTPIYLTYDLASTWAWATPIRDGAQPKIDDMAYSFDQYAPAGAMVFDMTLGQLVGALVLVGITLLPSLFEVGFPSMRHPLLLILLTAAILFDYVTDFESSWAATAGWSGAENWLVHFLWTALVFNPFVSIGVQALLVVCSTVVIFGFVRLIGGAAPAVLGEAVVIRR